MLSDLFRWNNGDWILTSMNINCKRYVLLQEHYPGRRSKETDRHPDYDSCLPNCHYFVSAQSGSMETRPAAETAGLFIGSKKVEMHEHASQDAPVPNKPRSKKKGAPAKLKISSGIQVSEESIEEDIAEIDTLQEPGRAQARPQSIAAFDPMHPKSKNDFHRLLSDLKRWRDEEQIMLVDKAGGSRAKRIELEQEALSKESYIIRQINKLRDEGCRDRKERETEEILAEMAVPDRWRSDGGKSVVVHTPITTYACRLNLLYRGLSSTSRPGERHRMLSDVKQIVSRHDGVIAKDLSDLIDRERDLLDRHLDKKIVCSLHARVRKLLLRFIETPSYNPAAS